MSEHVVSVEQGKLRGTTGIHFGGGRYHAFLGIPYARPPLGQLRFKAPRPPEPWEGVREATSEGSPCFARHLFFKTIVGDEDCLFLNVYTPELPGNGGGSTKPVMVWIHGGAFAGGSGDRDTYGPEYLLAHDVVVVTLNYRLGLLGFLRLEDPSLEVPGNAALKDIVSALRWVQKNISSFNGDPTNVTIFGESAGAAAVHYVTLSPSAEGLFHRAIIQSGSALNPWALAYTSAATLAEILGLPGADERAILKRLQEVPVEKVLEVQEKLRDPLEVAQKRPYGPVVESPPAETSFLAVDPLEALVSGKYSKVPVIFGYCKDEGILTENYLKKKKPPIHDDFEGLVTYRLGVKRGSEASKKIAQKIKEFYYRGEEPSIEAVQTFYDLETDIKFLRGIYSSAKLLVESDSPPVYFYRFSVFGEANLSRFYGQATKPGVAHADELGYLWKSALAQELRPGSLEHNTVCRLTKLWTNFAKSGDPNEPAKDGLLDVEWKPVQRGCFNYLDIGEKLKASVDPEKERMAFWDGIFGASPAASKL